MQSKKLMLIINPNAGKGGYRSTIGGVMEELSRGGWLPTVYFTEKRGDATEYVKEFSHEYEMVVCVGGDGTLSEVASGMMQLERRIPVGYIPMGTTNDVSKSLGISHNPAAAARQAATGTPKPFDIGLFNGHRYYSYIAAFGAFTEVSYATSQDMKQVLGHLAYILEGIKSVAGIRGYKAKVDYDGGSYEGEFIFGALMNSTSVGGVVKLTPEQVDLADGVSELVLIRKPENIYELNAIVQDIVTGGMSGGGAILTKTSKVRFQFDEEVSFTLDGEDGGSCMEAVIRNCHPGIDVMV